MRTPGPWEVVKHGTPAYHPQFGVYAPNGDGNDHAVVTGDNAEADAALIAAAPSLLIACRAMLECQADLCESCIRLARAAIAKAEPK
jgi:hypothetical protein